MDVFDLSEPQADYILELRLRRLTKFSRLELDEREDRARAADRGARGDPRRREAAAQDWSPTSWPTSPRRTARPRRTVLLESAGVPATTATPARGRRRPVLGAAVVHRAAGPHRRPPTRCPPTAARSSTTRSSAPCRTTARGEVGLVTSRGRLVRLSALELPALPPDQRLPQPLRRRAARGLRRPARRRGAAGPRVARRRTRRASPSARRRAS